MNQPQRLNSLPAPCIVDTGIIVNQDDIQRLLQDLNRVRYVHLIDDRIHSEGKGFIKEIFSDPFQSTLIANNNLYINLQSFDYLKLSKSTDKQTKFVLIQDNRQLHLIPELPSSSKEFAHQNAFNAATIEAMVTEVLSARLDVQLDDDEF
ncbi:MAG: hypothetical protein ACFCU5_01590 [Pleurocapsa sp.]